MIRQNAELEQKIVQIKNQKSEIEFKIKALAEDHAEQERVVRGVLGYVRPNETVIEFH